MDKNDNNLGNLQTDSDVSIIESLMKDLEEKFGSKLFKEIYDIIQDNVNLFFFLFYYYLDGSLFA